MSYAQTISLVRTRVLWLEGKNRELRGAAAANRSETDWAVRTYGQRPAGLVHTLLGPIGLFASPSYQNWRRLDQRMAADTSPKAANVRRATVALQALVPQFTALEQGATRAQMADMTSLLARVNTAIREGERQYTDWITHPAARFDTENTTMSARLFRTWAGLTPVGAAIRSGTTAHQAWQTVGAPVEEWVTTPGGAGGPSDVYGEHAGSAAAQAAAREKVEQGQWDWKDYLAATGAGFMGLAALYAVLKVRALTPVGMAAGVAHRTLRGKKPRTKFRGRK